MGEHFTKYNQHRPHLALDGKTPDEVYFGNLPALPKAVQVLTAKFPLKKLEMLPNQVEPSRCLIVWVCLSESTIVLRLFGLIGYITRFTELIRRSVPQGGKYEKINIAVCGHADRAFIQRICRRQGSCAGP